MNIEILTSWQALLAIGYLGMFSHFLKKNIQGETLVEIKDYFKNHFKSTLIAAISTGIGVIGYYYTMPVGDVHDPIAAFGIGYTFDSFLNKWDKA